MNNEEIIEQKYPLCIAAGVDGNEFRENELRLHLASITHRNLKLDAAIEQLHILNKIKNGINLTADDIDNFLVIDSIPGEIWKPLPDYETEYSVSDLGRIKSHISGIIMRRENDKGYRRICIRDKAGNKNYISVHRAVVQLFVPLTDDDIRLRRNEVNHINGIKHDDRAINLERCIHQENMQHAVDTGLKPSSLTHDLVARAVYLYDQKNMEIQDIIHLPEYEKLNITYMKMYKAIFRLQYKRFSDIPIPRARPTCIKGRKITRYALSVEDIIRIKVMKDLHYKYSEISDAVGYPKHVVSSVGKGYSKKNIKLEDYPDLVKQIRLELE